MTKMKKIEKGMVLLLLGCMMLNGCGLASSVTDFTTDTSERIHEEALSYDVYNEEASSICDIEDRVGLAAKDEESVNELINDSLVSKVSYYESSTELCDGNEIYYVEGKDFEKMMEQCKGTDENPTLVAKKWIKKMGYERMNESYLSNSNWNSDVNYYYPGFERPIRYSEYYSQYSYTPEGCQGFMTNLFYYMSGFDLKDETGVYNEVINGIRHDIPQIYYSPEDDCFYSYIQFRFKGVAYLLNIYFYGDDNVDVSNQKRFIAGIDAELVIARYMERGAAFDDSFDEFDDISLFFNVIFIEGVENNLTGKSFIRSKYYFNEDSAKISGGDFVYSTCDESCDVKESIRFEEVHGDYTEDKMSITEYKIMITPSTAN